MKFNSILTVILCALTCLSCKNTTNESEDMSALIQEEHNCKDFKNGTFLYDDIEYEGWKVIRNDSTSIEINEVTEEQIVSTITWLDDCTYVLKYKSHHNIPDEQIATEDIKVRILSTYKQTYFCEVKDSLGESRLTMKRIGD